MDTWREGEREERGLERNERKEEKSRKDGGRWMEESKKESKHMYRWTERERS